MQNTIDDHFHALYKLTDQCLIEIEEEVGRQKLIWDDYPYEALLTESTTHLRLSPNNTDAVCHRMMALKHLLETHDLDEYFSRKVLLKTAATIPYNGKKFVIDKFINKAIEKSAEAVKILEEKEAVKSNIINFSKYHRGF